MVYPKRCISCGSPLPHDNTQYACVTCWNSIERIGENSCAGCSAPLAYQADSCPACQRRPVSYGRLYAAALYRGLMRRYLHRIKFSNKKYIMQALAHLCITRCRQIPHMHTYDAVIPVPLHPARMRERGFNQAEILGKFIADEFSIPLITGLLVRVRNTNPQFNLTLEKRKQNIQNAFNVTKQAAMSKYKKIILVDDICTTGSTLSEAARALKSAGSKKITCFVLAKD
ncbi:MAG: ComF family protein [bacterium]